MGARRLHGSLGARLVILAALAIGIAGGIGLGFRGGRPRVHWGGSATAPAAIVGPTLHVPHLLGAIVLDSDTDDPGWTSAPGPARTGPFARVDGAAARPYSDARLVWGDGHLYLALYAADQDIETASHRADGAVRPGDFFRLLFSSENGDERFAIDVSPTGALDESATRRGGVDPTWRSGAHVSHEIDGTLDDSIDDDEEWVIEMAIPFDALGMTGKVDESIGFAVSRCDTPKNEERVCGGWGGWEGSGAGATSHLVLDR